MRAAKHLLRAVRFLYRCIGQLVSWGPFVSDTTNSAHPLDGAMARVNRAHEHINQLRSMGAKFAEEQADLIAVEFDPNRLDQPPAIRMYGHPAMTVFPGILIGESVYNLRAALDYLAHEIARRDSGTIQKTQFPIKDKPSDFWKKDGTAATLPGVNAGHLAAFEALQPYKGCNWTLMLRDLSNPDKHRELTLSAGQFQCVVYDDPDRIQFLNIPGVIKSAKHPLTGKEVKMKLDISSDILFADGTPVVPILDELETQVALTLQSFQAEFE